MHLSIEDNPLASTVFDHLITQYNALADSLPTIPRMVLAGSLRKTHPMNCYTAKEQLKLKVTPFVEKLVEELENPEEGTLESCTQHVVAFMIAQSELIFKTIPTQDRLTLRASIFETPNEAGRQVRAKLTLGAATRDMLRNLIQHSATFYLT